MFSSTIIPTINRPALSNAVQSVLDQNFDVDDFEVIVVNDSGQPLPPASWQKSRRVRVVNTNCRERSVARNTGAAIALGRYLHFLDDDDILLPGALNAFWELAQREPGADWLYGSWRTVDNDGIWVDEFHPEISGNIFALLLSGESLPLQASLLKAASFFRIGAYDPDSVLVGVEDRDVGRRLALYGNVANTAWLVAQVRIGEMGSSTNWKTIIEGDRWGREKILQNPHAFARLRDSAETSLLKGRVSRACFASMVWNLKHGNPLIAINRFVIAMAIAGPHVFFPSYWRGINTKVP